jgi:hypothetical protein
MKVVELTRSLWTPAGSPTYRDELPDPTQEYGSVVFDNMPGGQ